MYIVLDKPVGLGALGAQGDPTTANGWYDRWRKNGKQRAATKAAEAFKAEGRAVPADLMAFLNPAPAPAPAPANTDPTTANGWYDRWRKNGKQRAATKAAEAFKAEGRAVPADLMAFLNPAPAPATAVPAEAVVSIDQAALRQQLEQAQAAAAAAEAARKKARANVLRQRERADAAEAQAKANADAVAKAQADADRANAAAGAAETQRDGVIEQRKNARLNVARLRDRSIMAETQAKELRDVLARVNQQASEPTLAVASQVGIPPSQVVETQQQAVIDDAADDRTNVITSGRPWMLYAAIGGLALLMLMRKRRTR